MTTIFPHALVNPQAKGTLAEEMLVEKWDFGNKIPVQKILLPLTSFVKELAVKKEPKEARSRGE